MLWTPASDFQDMISNATGRPASGVPLGTSITLGGSANTFNSYTQILSGANNVADSYLMYFNINFFFTAATFSPLLVTLGKDEAGGTSYTDWVKDILACGPSRFDTNGPDGTGYTYAFPLFCKAGTSLAVKAMTNSASVGSFGVYIKLFCNPSRPDLVRCGAGVDAFGPSETTSIGTSITPGTTSEGAWTDLGTASHDYFFVEGMIGASDTVMTSTSTYLDIGAGSASSKKIVILDMPFLTSTTESFTKAALGRECEIKNGDHIYARAQQGGSDTGFYAAAYGVWG